MKPWLAVMFNPGQRAAHKGGSFQAVLDNVLICGGGSAVQGLPQRLLRQLRMSLPPSTVPGLSQVPEYMNTDTLRFAAWTGGAILSKVGFNRVTLALQATPLPGNLRE